MAGHDKLTAEGKKFYAEIEKLKKLECHVGFQHGDASEEDGTDIADIALWNELGTANTPARPFLKQSVDDNADKINAMCKTQLQAITKGATAEDVLKKIGVLQKSLVQEKIKSGDFEANAPSTIKAKGSDKPLIDTGRMRQSVNFVIKQKGG